MNEVKNEAQPIPVWAMVVLTITLMIGAIFDCYTGMYRAAVMRKAALTLCGFQLPKVSNVVTSLMILIMIDIVVWFTVRYSGSRKCRSVLCSLMFLAVFVVGINVVSCRIYTRGLIRQGAGTMQAALDIEYRQEEMKLMGTLGVYGGQIQLDGEAQFYVCRQIDAFGPFNYQVLMDTETQPFSTGYEEYLRFEEDGLIKLRALSVYQCQDGYWMVVKKFVNVDDLGIKLEVLDDLQRYIVQMQYSRHSGAQSEMLEQFEDACGDAVQRRR